MDGVLCDFVGAALRVHRCEDLLANWPRGEWDVAKVIGISDAEFWAGIDGDGFGFWSDLRPYPWAGPLVADLEDLGDVFVLSSPSRSHYSAAGKVVWLQRHFPQLATPGRWIFTERKDLVAAPGRILVDDNPVNVDAWRNRGGDAALFGQPWNGRGLGSAHDGLVQACDVLVNVANYVEARNGSAAEVTA